MSEVDRMYLYGAGGHANVVSEVLAANQIKIEGVFDDVPAVVADEYSGIKMVGEDFPRLKYPVIITIGDNHSRAEIARRLDVQFGIAIDPTAIVSPSAEVGEGTVILQGAIVQSNAKIGKHVLINTGASVDHDNVIGDYAHISPQVALCGHVEIGEGTHIGAAATVIPKVKIGNWCKIGAGAVVIDDIPDYATAVGNPARVIRQSRPEIQQAGGIDEFDVAFVGSGLSSTMSLINLIKRLMEEGIAEPLRIAVIEAASDFFGGVAYGCRTGVRSLIITDLEHFVPEPEVHAFKQWLTTNKDWIFEEFEKDAGAAARTWLSNNAAAITNDQWDQLFLPRYVFGRYLAEIARDYLARATAAGLIRYRLINSAATNLIPDDQGYEIKLLDANSQPGVIRTRKVVLALGSPPFRKIFDDRVYSPKLGGLLINCPYQQGLQSTLDRISQHLQSSKTELANVLIVGSNASTMEVLYNLYDDQSIFERIGKITVISMSGEFPAQIRNETTARGFIAEALERLSNSPQLTAQEIFEAAREDLLRSRQGHPSFTEVFDVVNPKVHQLLQRLEKREKQKFVDFYGNELGKYQRRAGQEYSDIVDRLISAGKLVNLKGKFLQIATHAANGFRFDYEDPAGAMQRFAEPIQVAISCSGFEKIGTESSSALIRNLLRGNLITPNPSHAGIEVDERLTAGPGIFVIGPMLGGNLIGDEMVWHVEHCGRILRYAEVLATVLADEFSIGRVSA